MIDDVALYIINSHNCCSCNHNCSTYYRYVLLTFDNNAHCAFGPLIHPRVGEEKSKMSRWEHLWWIVEGVGISGFKINWDCRKSRSELWIHCNECSLSVVEYLFPSLLWIVQMLFRMRWRSLAHTMKAYCSISQQHKFVQRIWLLGARFSRAEMTRPCFKALVILYFVVTVNETNLIGNKKTCPQWL